MDHLAERLEVAHHRGVEFGIEVASVSDEADQLERGSAGGAQLARDVLAGAACPHDQDPARPGDSPNDGLPQEDEDEHDGRTQQEPERVEPWAPQPGRERRDADEPEDDAPGGCDGCAECQKLSGICGEAGL